MSLRSSVAPPGHCVPGIPEPRPLPPYSYLYTGFSGTTTWQAPLAAASPWSPTALPVPVTVSRLYRYRYGYAAGPLGVQRTPGSCSLRLAPVPSPCLFRYGYVAGHLREQRAVGHHFYCPRHRLPFIVPPIAHGPLDCPADIFTGVACWPLKFFLDFHLCSHFSSLRVCHSLTPSKNFPGGGT